MVIRVCYINIKAKCDMLRQKNGRGLASMYFFFFCSMRGVFHFLFDVSVRRAACMT